MPAALKASMNLSRLESRVSPSPCASTTTGGGVPPSADVEGIESTPASFSPRALEKCTAPSPVRGGRSYSQPGSAGALDISAPTSANAIDAQRCHRDAHAIVFDKGLEGSKRGSRLGTHRGRGAPVARPRAGPRGVGFLSRTVPPPPAPPRPSVDILERSALMPSSVSSSLRACTTLLIKPAGSRASHPREVPEEEWLQRRHSEQGEVLALPPPTRKSARRHKPASPRYYGARDLDAPLLAARRTHAAAE